MTPVRTWDLGEIKLIATNKRTWTSRLHYEMMSIPRSLVTAMCPNTTWSQIQTSIGLINAVKDIPLEWYDLPIKTFYSNERGAHHINQSTVYINKKHLPTREAQAFIELTQAGIDWRNTHIQDPENPYRLITYQEAIEGFNKMINYVLMAESQILNQKNNPQADQASQTYLREKRDNNGWWNWQRKHLWGILLPKAMLTYGEIRLRE